MAYDAGLAQILEEDLSEQTRIQTRKMFGGLCFMHRGHMLCGVHKSKDKLSDMAMFRVGPEHYETALEMPGVNEMSFTGRPMRGIVEANADVFENDKLRGGLIQMALDFTQGLPEK